MSEEKREVVYYSTREDEERLTFVTPGDAVENTFHKIGDVLTVYEWARMRKPKAEDCCDDRGGPLDRLLTHLGYDCELWNPDEGYEPTDAMLAAEKVFVEAVLKDYTPWSCETVTQ